MKKAERIIKYGEVAFAKFRQQSRDWHVKHHEEDRVNAREWKENNMEKVIENRHAEGRKGGKYYERHLKYEITGLQGERNKIRKRHADHYRPYKQIIAPESQIHHEWIPETANFRGVALVEKESHQYGIIDVIQILEGGITLLTEAEIRNNGEMSE